MHQKGNIAWLFGPPRCVWCCPGSGVVLLRPTQGEALPLLTLAIFFVFTVRDRGVLHGCRTITITKDIVQKQVGIYLSLLSPTGYNIDMTIDGSESRGATEKHEHRQGANLRFAPVLPGENLTTFFCVQNSSWLQQYRTRYCRGDARLRIGTAAASSSPQGNPRLPTRHISAQAVPVVLGQHQVSK